LLPTDTIHPAWRLDCIKLNVKALIIYCTTYT
jgi:hypothetical protein